MKMLYTIWVLSYANMMQYTSQAWHFTDYKQPFNEHINPHYHPIHYSTPPSPPPSPQHIMPISANNGNPYYTTPKAYKNIYLFRVTAWQK